MSHRATTQLVVDGSPTDAINMESSPTSQRRENDPKSDNVSSPARSIGLADTVCVSDETADATQSVIDEAAVIDDENVTSMATPTQTAVAAKENVTTATTGKSTEVIADEKSTMVTQSTEVSVILSS